MLATYIPILSELALFVGIIAMLLVRLFRHNITPKTFYTISKVFFIIAGILSIVFYNKSYKDLFSNNHYTTLFKTTIYIFVISWSYLSLKYFQNKNRSSFSFYLILMINILCFSMAISTKHIDILFICTSISLILNYFLLKLNPSEDKWPVMIRFGIFVCFFIILYAIGVFIIYLYSGSFEYSLIEKYLSSQANISWQIYLAFTMIICSFLFMLGIAPFHFWFPDTVGSSVLPVSGYLTLIPIFAYLSCLINIIINVFYPIYEWFEPVMLIFGCLSIFLGAIGANSQDDLRKIFASGSLYYIGVIAVTISEVNDQTLLSCCTYLFIYMLAMGGIYTVFNGYKVKGEYISKLADIRGISTQRPFLSASMLIFMISLIGMPPLIGFFGKLSVINRLVIEGNYIEMLVILFSMLILVYAYLRIITVVYFEPRNNSFDRVDKGVYICLVINIILIVLAVVNPKYLMHDIKTMLVVIL
jgi:NADH-quinone oxidoreductase subunit N